MNEKSVFVSYATQDKGIVVRLKERLRAATGGALTFFDSFDGESIPPGEDWNSTIAAALCQADAVLVLVTQYSERSQWVLYEIGYASANDKRIIPILLPGYPSIRIPPLDHRQQVVIESADSLKQLVKRLAVLTGRDISAEFTSDDLTYIFGDNALDGRHLPRLEATSLASRDAIYWQINTLVSSSGKDARIRATSTLLDSDTTSDPIFDDYIKNIAKKIGDSKRQRGVADYTLVMSYEVDDDGMPLQERQQSIRNRLDAFKDKEVDALDRITIYRRPEPWGIEVFILGENEAVLGFPAHPHTSKLHNGVHISGIDFVIHLIHWFETCAKNGATLVDPETLKLRPRGGLR